MTFLSGLYILLLAIIYGFIKTPEEFKAVYALEDYFFYPENVFAENEKVYVLAQYIDKDNKPSDRLLILNTKACKLEETNSEFEGRVAAFKNGTPVISKVPLMTRSVMTVPCGNRIFVFNGEGNFIYSFDL